MAQFTVYKRDKAYWHNVGSMAMWLILCYVPLVIMTADILHGWGWLIVWLLTPFSAIIVGQLMTRESLRQAQLRQSAI